MELQNGNWSGYQKLEKQAGSDTTCDVKLPISPSGMGRRCYQALGRREIPRAFIARFHSKYKRGDGCWLWTAGIYRGRGYGMVNLGRYADGRQHTEYAHRVAYVLAKGDIPAGAVVMHGCDVPACVNPAHLSLGTQGDNVRDASQKGRSCVPHLKARRLTDGDVAAICASLASGDALARCYRVSKTSISLIRRGLRRKAA